MVELDSIIEKMRAEFRMNLQVDTELKNIRQKIYKGYTDAGTAYAYRAGQIEAEIFKKYALTENGDIEKVKALLYPIFSDNYRSVSNMGQRIVQNINDEAQIGLKATSPSMDSKAIDEIVDTMKQYENLEDSANMISKKMVNESCKTFDDLLSLNAKIQRNAGLDVTVTRIYDNVGVHTTDKHGRKKCQWCLDRVGTDVPYAEAKERGMFQRHEGCGCTILYKTNKKTYRQSKNDWQDNSWTALNQSYKPIVRDEKVKTFKTLKNITYHTNKINGYNNVFVEESTSVKRKTVQNAIKNTNVAVKKYGITELNDFKVVFVDKSTLGTVGLYDAPSNTIFYATNVNDKNFLKNNSLIAGDVEHHEVWHLKQADNYVKTGKQITINSYAEYMENLSNVSLKNIERLGIDEYNVSAISQYAKVMYNAERYDEVEAEYYTKKIRKE